MYCCCLLELIQVVVYTVSSLCIANQQYVLDSLKPHCEPEFGFFEIVSDKMCTTAINLKFGYYFLYLVFIFFNFFYSLLCGSSWSWSYGSYNRCLSPLKLWVRIPFMERCTRYNIIYDDKVCHWLTTDRSVVFSGYSGFLHQ